MLVKEIITPSDFKRTLNYHSFEILEWLSLKPEFETKIRHTIEAIFSDIQYIGLDEPEVVSSFLDGIDEPLNELRGIGLQLFFIGTTGTYTMASSVISNKETKIPDWRHGYYIIAPKPCFYCVDPENDKQKIHLLCENCEEGIKEVLIGKGKKIKYWFSQDLLEKDYEHNVPWCDTCFIEQIQK